MVQTDCRYTYPTRFLSPVAELPDRPVQQPGNPMPISAPHASQQALRYWVEAPATTPAAPRMTAQQPRSRDCRTTPPAIARNRDCCIFRTGWQVSASPPHRQQRPTQRMQARRDPPLIDAGHRLNPGSTTLLLSPHGRNRWCGPAPQPPVPRETPVALRAQFEKTPPPAQSAADVTPHPRRRSVPSACAGSPVAFCV